MRSAGFKRLYRKASLFFSGRSRIYSFSITLGLIPAIHPCLYLTLLARPFFLPELYPLGLFVLDLFFPLNMLLGLGLEEYVWAKEMSALGFLEWGFFSLINIIFWFLATAFWEAFLGLLRGRVWPGPRWVAISSMALGIVPILYPCIYVPVAALFDIKPLYSVGSVLVDIFGPARFVVGVYQDRYLPLHSTQPSWPFQYWPSYFWRWLGFGLLNIGFWYLLLRGLLLCFELLRSRRSD